MNRKLATLILLLVAGQVALAQKKVIKTVDDIPIFTYTIKGTATELFQSKEEFSSLVTQLEKDYTGILSDYEIADNTLLKDVYGTLKNIDFYRGNFNAALIKVKKIKELQEKPADKLMSGLSNQAYFKAAMKGSEIDDRFRDDFRTYFAEMVATLPWDVVQDDVEQSKGSLEIFSENLYLGIIQERIDPGVEKTGTLSSDMMSRLISYNYAINHVLPVKEQMIEVYSNYIAANKVEKADIWMAREVDLSQEKGLSPVIVAIWDSGVDVPIFANQINENTNEKFDGKDTDGNGFVDDVNGIAYDLDGNKTSSVLYPLTQDQVQKLPQMIDWVKGLQDLQASIDSDEATALKRKMSQIKPQEVRPFIEEISLFGNYAHGTHVAGIAAKGNPKAVILPARLTFDYRMIPDPPTKELYTKFAISTKQSIEYFKKSGVRIVNMSWGDTPQSVESGLEANGIGATAEERKEMAREIFDIGKKGLYEAIQGAPEILFITAAGNSDFDSEFYEAIPSSYELPNILTVGAVDQAGEETGFTSFGKNVDVHANGFEVESYVPGGQTMKMSGTSMASPNVVNLAAKLMVIDPSLSVQETIELILGGAEKSDDGRRNLVNPKTSIALLKKRAN